MASDTLRYVFANAASAITLRTQGISLYKGFRRDFCRSIAVGFGMGESVGDDIYTHATEMDEYVTNGFDSNTSYDDYETSVKNIFETFAATVNLTDNQKKLLSVPVTTILFGFAVNPTATYTEIVKIIGDTLYDTSERIIGFQVFQSSISNGTRIVSHPFSQAVIKSLLTSNDFLSVFNQINSSPKDVEVDLVHYNYYDTTNVFVGPKPDKMMDAENQYYYLSGGFSYPDIPSNLIFCEEETVTITQEDGSTKEILVINNSPCIESTSFTGPLTGTKFYREFNDGPYSSGNFTKEVKAVFKDFDKSKLSGVNYSGNLIKLYDFNANEIYAGGIQKDVEGIYNINEEYSKAPIDTGCLNKYQVMRVGDGRIRSQCLAYDENENCISCNEQLVTGFKYANITLDESIWNDRFAYCLTNPPTDMKRTMIRALNMVENPYIGRVVNGEITAEIKTGPSTWEWYIGPHQIGSNQLPYLAFTNDFASNTFSKNAKVVLFPAIGSSEGGSFGESNREFSVSPIPLLTGIDTNTYSVEDIEGGNVPTAKFNVKISAFTSGDDDIKAKVFGMGNAFNGNFSITASQEENAGYLYSGYVLKDLITNETFSEIAVAESWSSYKIGSPYSEAKYISGYTGKSNLEINRMYGKDASGNYIQYYYFDNRLTSETILGTGWDTFAPLPSNIESNPSYSRAYSSQRVENNYQRYYRGPYATYVKKFLYPNAATTDLLEPDNNIGFPVKYEYVMTVREETVKELYSKFQISNGWIYTTPKYIPAIRTEQSNFGAPKQTMPTIFGSSDQKFDFTKWNISNVGFFYTSNLENAVYNNYAPVHDNYFEGLNLRDLYASGKNDISIFDSQPVFKQGILITGNNEILTHRVYVNSERDSGIFKFSPKPNNYSLFHGFTGYKISGSLTYTRPIFRMDEGIIDKSFSISSMPNMATGCLSYYFHNTSFDTPSIGSGFNNLLTKGLNGNIFYSHSGEDPIYFENIGGRRGGESAITEGGYHSKGIIGDSWMGLNAQTYGCYCSQWSDVCEDGDYYGNTFLNYSIDANTNDNRFPDQDKRLFFVNVTPSKTTIYTRGLDYNPMGFDYKNPQYSNKSSAPAVSKSTTVTFNETSKAFKLSLSSLMPSKKQTTANEWYLGNENSGIIVGPFDRDVELFVGTGESITGYNSFYINNRKMSDLLNGDNTLCNVPTAPSAPISELSNMGDGTLYNNIKLLTLVPSGDYATINCQGTPTVSSSSKVGFAPNANLYIRARTVLNEAEYDPINQAYLNISGSNYWLHNLKFINNGSERVFSFDTPNNDPSTLKGASFTFLTFSRSGKFYPKPDITELNNYWATGKFGNEVWSISDMEDFYSRKTAKENSTVYVTGWREGSRISFEFNEFKPIYDEAPYESHSIVIPSGNCQISGQMGYLGQADKTIFSEGFSLEDITINDPIKDKLYKPQFVSTVLARVPFFEYPIGNYKNPVLEAPSIMKQRENLKIESSPDYTGINSNSPDNYNKLLWPAFSDLRSLNPEETLEEMPPADGNTFLNSTLLLSAAQGQRLPNGNLNPNVQKRYAVRSQFQMYDSISTDALINPDNFLLSGKGTVVELVQPASGYTVPRGTTLTQIIMDLT